MLLVLDVLVCFEPIFRLEITPSRVFCDCEEQQLGERSEFCENTTLFYHGVG
jgi:hypothetical protein